MGRRGLTLVELVLVLSLMVIVIGSIGGIFAFTVNRAAYASANYTTMAQARKAADIIDATIRSAVHCRALSEAGNSGLKCTMPANGVDTDGDGYHDQFSPMGISKRGAAKWGTGQRVWFYFSNGSGAWAHAGPILWRARRVDDSYPGTGDRDQAFPKEMGSAKDRFGLIAGIVWSSSDATCLVNYTMTATSLARSERKATVNDSSGYTFVLSRTVNWRNWRK